MSAPSYTDAAPSPPSRTTRLGGLLTHPERSAALLAILIGFASVFSAVVAWRASLASIDASRLESLAVQQQARSQQIEREIGGTVDQDLRFLNAFQEHALAARELQAQAEVVRESDATAADILDLEAQARLALARATLPFFLGASGIQLAEDGSVPYDTAFVLRNLEAGNGELRELRTQPTVELAQRADVRSLNLIGVAALSIAALFFLTIAQVSRTRIRVRQAFFVLGGLTVFAGTLGYVFVEVFT